MRGGSRKIEEFPGLLERRPLDSGLGGKAGDPLIAGHSSQLSGMPASSRVALGGTMLDRLKRPLRDLRISVTDRCNMRCPYCMPRQVFGPEYPFLAREKLLDFE